MNRLFTRNMNDDNNKEKNQQKYIQFYLERNANWNHYEMPLYTCETNKNLKFKHWWYRVLVRMWGMGTHIADDNVYW